MSIPSTLLITFFQESTKALNELTLAAEELSSGSHHRERILDVQKRCLTRVLGAYPGIGEQQVQQELRRVGSTQGQSDASITQAMDEMNGAARLAYCRLTLEEFGALGQPPTNLIKTAQLPRKAIFEFFGLVQGAVKLPKVQDYLVSGQPMFEAMDEDKTRKFPQERLEWIQRVLMMSIGYDPDFGTAEIKRIFFEGNGNPDPDLLHLFHQTVSEMQVSITNATLKVQENQLNDTKEGGVTRVVSVTYSEKDAGQPKHETSIHSSATEQQQFKMAQQAAALQQSILAELLQMDEESRDQELEKAKLASLAFQQKVMELPQGPERVRYMTSVTPDVQRQLLMHKLWGNMMEKHGGKPPTMHYQK